MTQLKARAQKVYTRLGGSIFLYLVFVGLNLNAQFLGNNTSGLLSLLPLALAVFALPRNSYLEPDDIHDPQQMALAERIERIDKLAFLLRGLYVFGALIVLMVLPRLIPAPTP